ncbi:acyl-CoA dehydrogenase family protein [Streptomyces orinoci]|uniref:Acyl-CoA dehydrogenase family protein n=1 Tax=Streptomyces orinoci TaxID=67339 RepID=A0ABV3JRX1_STRON|nr:acyl-CoA dehydrogenase family protein [Streptomyces orinoci]
MRFSLDTEQREFGRTLARLLAASDAPAAARAWARGEYGPGRALCQRLGDAGVFALAVPEKHGGCGPLPVEIAVAFEELGHHAVPGPLVETVAAAILLGRLGGVGAAEEWLPRVSTGHALLSLAAPASDGYALDAETADAVVVAGETEVRLWRGACGAAGPEPADGNARACGVAGGQEPLDAVIGGGPGAGSSLDPVRRLSRPPRGGEPLAHGPAARAAVEEATLWAAFATAAQALGVGQALLDRSVEYARQRRQFGVAIGSFQAVKHRLADVLIGLEFARPLVYGAAVALAAAPERAAADVAAAKVAAGEAGYAAARAALQVHGAIGYTAEYDLSLWIGRARALRCAWGTPGECRRRVLTEPFHK